MSYSNGNVDLTMSNMRINNIKDDNKDFKKFIAEELDIPLPLILNEDWIEKLREYNNITN